MMNERLILGLARGRAEQMAEEGMAMQRVHRAREDAPEEAPAGRAPRPSRRLPWRLRLARR